MGLPIAMVYSIAPLSWWERFSRHSTHNVCLRRPSRSPIVIGCGNLSFRAKGDLKMAWKAPKIIEVPVGMEINMYACAARK